MFVVGYTRGGAPYGLVEWGDRSSSVDTDRDGISFNEGDEFF
jgi:hypothetical protein